MNVLTQVSLISLIFMGLFLPRAISFRSVVVVVVFSSGSKIEREILGFRGIRPFFPSSVMLNHHHRIFSTILRPHFRCCRFRATIPYSSDMQDEGNDNNRVENAVNWRAVRSLHSLYCIQYHNYILSRDPWMSLTTGSVTIVETERYFFLSADSKYP